VSALDQVLQEMRDGGLRFHAAGPQKNRLQPMFLEDLRFEQRLHADVMVVQSAPVLGWDDAVSFVVARDAVRVAVQLVPKDVADQFKGFEYAVLSGGDIDSVIRFSGPDLHYRGKDCLALFAKLCSDFYHPNGLLNALHEAEPAIRDWQPSGPGWDAIDVAGEDESGEEELRQLRFYWGRRYRRRRERLVRQFRAADAPPFEGFDVTDVTDVA